jgi:hypothetical protein
MLDEISKNKFKAKDYDQAPFMTAPEKKISFLNRYFVYKKIRTVNTENVELELGEYQETAVLRNAEDTKQAQNVAKEEVKILKPKIRKLSKKLLLVAATEAIDEPQPSESVKKTKKTKVPQIPAKKIIIENDDE